MRKTIVTGLLGAALVCFGVNSASAAAISAGTLTFTCITGNNAGACATGEAQLQVEVFFDPADPDSIMFLFTNTGANASSITDVYFDDDGLLSSSGVVITESAGVDFGQGASPGDLPGGNSVGFEVSAGLSFDSEPPTQQNGVNPGEQLMLTFALISPFTFFDVINAINSGQLQIGIHVQGFAGGFSESFVNNSGGDDTLNVTVPEPTSLSLLGLGLAALAGSRRRREQAV